jgi:hypothetical protein
LVKGLLGEAMMGEMRKPRWVVAEAVVLGMAQVLPVISVLQGMRGVPLPAELPVFFYMAGSAQLAQVVLRGVGVGLLWNGGSAHPQTVPWVRARQAWLLALVVQMGAAATLGVMAWWIGYCYSIGVEPGPTVFVGSGVVSLVRDCAEVLVLAGAWHYAWTLARAGGDKLLQVVATGILVMAVLEQALECFLRGRELLGWLLPVGAGAVAGQLWGYGAWSVIVIAWNVSACVVLWPLVVRTAWRERRYGAVGG